MVLGVWRAVGATGRAHGGRFDFRGPYDPTDRISIGRTVFTTASVAARPPEPASNEPASKPASA